MALMCAERLSKSFGAVRALDNVSLDVESGTVHAIVGENGAGKSTLVSVLSGLLLPDQGMVTVSGVPCKLGDARGARMQGIGTVHQHFMLVPELSVQDNLALDAIGSSPGRFDPVSMAAPALRHAAELGWDVDPSALVSDLSVGQQQRIEILKVLAHDSRLLLLDEPTAVLSESEVDELFKLLGQVRDSGRAAVLVAHKLDEIFRIADRITVLRDGRLVGNWAVSDTSPAQIAEEMVGTHFPKFCKHVTARTENVVLEAAGIAVCGDRGNEAVRGVDLIVHAGETVGIGGVDGNGQNELAEALVGQRALVRGSVIRTGGPVAYVPGDRRRHGLAQDMDLESNLLVSHLDDPGLTNGPFISHSGLTKWSSGLLKKYEVKAPSTATLARNLSGGNQQKVVLARVLSSSPRVLVVVNPTRGLDFAATDFVRRQIAKCAADGAGVVLVSNDREEIAALADRSYQMERGRLLEVLT